MSGQPGDSQMPDSPMTELAQGAATLHELFTAYVSAGFTRPEALHLTTALLVARAGGGS